MASRRSTATLLLAPHSYGYFFDRGLHAVLKRGGLQPPQGTERWVLGGSRAANLAGVQPGWIQVL